MASTTLWPSRTYAANSQRSCCYSSTYTYTFTARLHSCAARTSNKPFASAFGDRQDDNVGSRSAAVAAVSRDRQAHPPIAAGPPLDRVDPTGAHSTVLRVHLSSPLLIMSPAHQNFVAQTLRL
ncbi:unnamed protein product [Haemonchus placei]|uniref:Uncharacterized protein n=1 Tax=Haemonchus placei TaxID=6290 RepID=A0A0N4WQR4_HAEPC|nr:unnamed protein product [Haemonchus placei]